MSLWFSSLFLVSGCFLSISALTPEECEPLITPLSLDDPSQFYGRVNFIAGYTDSDDYNNLLKMTSSSWMNFTSSPSSSSELVLYQANKINGTCTGSRVNVTTDGDTAMMSVGDLKSSVNVLPSCDGCLLFNSTSSLDLNKFFRFMNINSAAPEGQVTVRAFYLMAKETTVKDSDLEHFKKQASCLGFSGEPNFLYDSKEAFCQEDEVLMLVS